MILQVWLFFEIGLALIALWVLAKVAEDLAELVKQALLAGARFLSSRWKPIR